ncbi:unnamed protein product [Rotaria sp. Silwood2]|nr:unnamed protein product [Rotaria sp. Silwood2]
MSEELKKEVIYLTGCVKMNLYDGNEDEAVKILDDIINKLSPVNHEDKMIKNVLLVSYIERIELLYKKEKYEAYGINSTNKCWDTLHYTVILLCSTPDTYLFIDQFHFTTRVHQFIADAIRKFLIKWKGPFRFHRSIFSV